MLPLCIRICLLLAVLSACTQAAVAQVTWDGCLDALGTPVASVNSPWINDVAMAGIEAGAPIIRYNTTVLALLHPTTRLFFYGHECGHHALGHALGTLTLNREQEADCYGIVTLVEEGLLDDDDVPKIQADLSRSPGNWDHLPGPYRAINLRRCLRDFESRLVHVACIHQMHQADQYACQHWVATPYGLRPMHPLGDLFPCQHAAHEEGHEVLTITRKTQ
jgi:hypothetical protein